MSRQDDLDRYERDEAQDILRLFEAARPLHHATPSPDFRAQIWQAVGQRRSRRGIWVWFTDFVTPAWVPALAAILLLSLGVNVWLGSRLIAGRGVTGLQMAVNDTEPRDRLLPPHAYAFQETLQHRGNLGRLVREQTLTTQPMVGFGFAAKPAPERSFLMGTFYAEALAYARSGQLQAAAQRWAAIETELGQMAAPLAAYIRHMHTKLQQPAVSPETVGAFLALFEPLYEAYSGQASDAALPLFRAGTWLTNMRVAAGAGDTVSLRSPAAVRYFQQEMRRLQAPKGVLDALDRLELIVAQEKLSERDTKVILKLVTKMQSLLG